jgi:hypothetical protein
MNFLEGGERGRMYNIRGSEHPVFYMGISEKIPHCDL